MDARPARQALLEPRPLRRGRARVPPARTRSSRATPTGSTRSPPRRPRAGSSAPRSRSERAAVELNPLPQYVAALGDLYAVTGQPALAQRQYALIGAIEKLLRANGVRTDLEIALFQVDHGIRLRHALELARIGARERPSIDGDDVLAWALARNGRARRRCRTRSTRCGSARRTRSSSSTAG